MKKLSVVIVASGVLAFAGVANAAGNPCRSYWQKAGSAFQKLGPPISKLLCSAFNKDDPDSAAKCVRDYEKAKDKIEKLGKAYNSNAGAGKIGPRGLGVDRHYTGNLKAERVFIGPPLESDSWKLDFEVTGGKAKKAWNVKVCLVDDNGQAPQYKTKKFKNAKRGQKWSHRFKGVYGLRPVVYLHKPAGVNGVKYKLRGHASGEPAVIKSARLAMKSKKGKKRKLKKRRRR